jgi:hypothetical protein
MGSNDHRDRELCPRCHALYLWPGETYCGGCAVELLEEGNRQHRPVVGVKTIRLTQGLKKLIHATLKKKGL